MRSYIVKEYFIGAVVSEILWYRQTQILLLLYMDVVTSICIMECFCRFNHFLLTNLIIEKFIYPLIYLSLIRTSILTFYLPIYIFFSTIYLYPKLLSINVLDIFGFQSHLLFYFLSFHLSIFLSSIYLQPNFLST